MLLERHRADEVNRCRLIIEKAASGQAKFTLTDVQGLVENSILMDAIFRLFDPEGRGKLDRHEWMEGLRGRLKYLIRTIFYFARNIYMIFEIQEV